MVGYHLMADDHSVQLAVWGWGGTMTPPAAAGQHPGGNQNFLKKFLNIGLKKMFEKLKIDTFNFKNGRKWC